jgi:hypothetical protein
MPLISILLENIVKHTTAQYIRSAQPAKIGQGGDFTVTICQWPV